MSWLLLVEDDLDVADAFSAILLEKGHRVRAARNGEEALAMLVGELPDLILCDVEMPVLDGPGLANCMQVRNAGLERVPIVLTSGVVDLHRVADRVGTPYYLRKPFTLQQLFAMLDRALAERAAPRPKPAPR